MVVSLNTFLFADLCDYTEHTFRQGDEFAAELAVGFHLLVRELAATESCEVVKAIGDAVMVRAAQVEDAIRLAHRIHESGQQLGYPRVRVGIDTGPAVARDGDWYGTTVNRAARVAEAADPGEMLLTEGARAALTPSMDVRVVERGVRALKGLPESRLHTAYAGGLNGDGYVGAANRPAGGVAPGWPGGGPETAAPGVGVATRPGADRTRPSAQSSAPRGAPTAGRLPPWPVTCTFTHLSLGSWQYHGSTSTTCITHVG